jgi:hypothetical protein
MSSRFAIIENQKVINIVLASPEVAAERGWIECPYEVGIGWTFDGVGEALPPEPDTEATASLVRLLRNNLLVESDKEVLFDRWSLMTTEQQTAWTAYRQALRDVSLQEGFPFTIVWPIQP